MKLVEYYSVIGHDATYRICILLAHYALSVQEIANALNLSQPHVSHKLARLRQFDYVNFNRQGKRTFYRLKEPWRSILLHGNVMWHKLNPEFSDEGSTDLLAIKKILGQELDDRTIYPVISSTPVLKDGMLLDASAQPANAKQPA
ncbi:helix-turn-helix transcriptional regulator [bacterium]|nr:helix-turn-helix transcriptional regulator [bacterium]